MEEYRSQTNRSMNEVEAVDALKKKWSGNPLELLLEFLVSFYAVPSNSDKTHPLLQENLVSLGSAFVADKKLGSIFQVLYVKQRAMTASPRSNA